MPISVGSSEVGVYEAYIIQPLDALSGQSMSRFNGQVIEVALDCVPSISLSIIVMALCYVALSFFRSNGMP